MLEASVDDVGRFSLAGSAVGMAVGGDGASVVGASGLLHPDMGVVCRHADETVVSMVIEQRGAGE